MPKGHTKYTKYESELLKANKQLRKALARMERAATELEARPDPVVTPKPVKKAQAPGRQLRLPGTVGSRKAAKAPAKPRKSRAQRS